MLYQEYMDEVKKITLITNETNGLTYIRPDYEYVLASGDLKLSDVTDFPTASVDTVYKQLILERDMRNANVDKMPLIAEWIHAVINTVIEPAIVEQQNQLIKDMIEYRKEKNAIDTRTKELNLKEQALEDKNKVLPMNFGIDFSKKKAK